MRLTDAGVMASLRRNALDKLKNKQYTEIMAHERAHQSVAGSYAGGIVIEYDNNGVAIAGHVPIRMPGLDVQDPKKSIQAYQTIRAAALSPGKPSAQDVSVANLAQAQIGKAQVLMDKLRAQKKNNHS